MGTAEGSPPEDCRVRAGELNPENTHIRGEEEGGFEQMEKAPLLPEWRP